MRSHLAVAALLGVLGCGKGERSPTVDPDRQTRRDAMLAVCAAEQQCCKDKERNSLEVALWLETNVVNPTVVTWLKSQAPLDLPARTASFRAELAAVKIAEADCPTFASWSNPPPREPYPGDP